MNSKNKRLSKILLLSGIATLVVLAGVFIVLEKNGTTHFTSIGKKAIGKKQEQQATNQQKASVANNPNIPTATSSNQAKSPNQADDYTTPNSANSINLTASRTSANEVTVLAKLYGFSDGTCMLTTTNGSSSDQQSAAVIYQQEFSSCAGFNVPVSKLGSGNWTIHLTVHSGNTTIEKAITYAVN